MSNDTQVDSAKTGKIRLLAAFGVALAIASYGGRWWMSQPEPPKPLYEKIVDGDELGPNETLILGASIITVGIVAGMAERAVFGDKQSREEKQNRNHEKPVSIEPKEWSGNTVPGRNTEGKLKSSLYIFGCPRSNRKINPFPEQRFH